MVGLARGLTCASPSPRRPLRAPPPPQPPGRRAAHLCSGLPPRLSCCRPPRAGEAGRPSPPSCPCKVVCGPRRAGLAATADSTAIRVSQTGLPSRDRQAGFAGCVENFIGFLPMAKPAGAKHRHTHTTRLPSGSLGWRGTPRGRARSDPPPRLETIATVPWGWAQRGAADDGAHTQVARNNGGLCSRIHMHTSNLRRCCCRRRPGSRPAL